MHVIALIRFNAPIHREFAINLGHRQTTTDGFILFSYYSLIFANRSVLVESLNNEETISC